MTTQLLKHINYADTPNMLTMAADAGITVPLVAVYCGSRAGNDVRYTEQAYAFGQALVKAGLGLVYGGGSVGMMGAVADGVLSEDGVAVGIIPDFLTAKEKAHKGVGHLYISDSMHTRKALMATYASAFVVLAGGFGTLDEVMEIATWRQLDQHQKPIMILNTNGFYDAMIAHIKHTAEVGFMRQIDCERIEVYEDIEALIGCLIGRCRDDNAHLIAPSDVILRQG